MVDGHFSIAFTDVSPVRISHFSRSVDNAAHNGNGYVPVDAGYAFFYLVCKGYEVDIRSSAGRAGYQADALPQIVVCVALIVCGMWLVRGPKNKKGKQPPEEEAEDFHAYTAAPQAENTEDTADTADTDPHFAMPELSALLGEPVTGAEQDETPAEDDDDRAE